MISKKNGHENKKGIPRKLYVTIFFFLIMISPSITNVAEADGMIVPIQTVTIIPLEITYPEIEYHFVNVTINDQYAHTSVDQSFYNPYNSTITGTYIFPVPFGATISSFKMIIDGVEHEAEVLGKEDTRAFIEEAIKNSQDASLLEYIDREVFSYEVSIKPKESIQICLEYEEIILMKGGMYRYIYTLGTERYSLKDIPMVSLTIDMHSDKGIRSIYSPSHDIIIKREGEKDVIASYEVQNSRPHEDFELYFAVSDMDFGASFLNYEEGDDGFFMFFLSSSFGDGEEDYIPKDIIFVIDESGSMSGEKINDAKNALKYILGQLSNQDRFSIIRFDSSIALYSQSLKYSSSYNILDASNYVDKINAGGSTNINEALLDAIDLHKNVKNPSSARIIVFITDGLATAGVTDNDQIVENIRTANIEEEVDASIFVVGIGYNVNTHLLDKIAQQNHGFSAYIKPGENLESSLTDIYGKISSPVLTNISIAYEEIEAYDIYPTKIPDLYEGSEITQVGRYNITSDMDTTVKITVRGITSQGPKELVYEFDIFRSKEKDFIPRIWATRKIGYLLNVIKLEGETNESIDKVKELGFKYGIVTPYTSMLIKSEEDNEVTSNMSHKWQLEEDTGGVAVSNCISMEAYFQDFSTRRANVAVGGNVFVSGTATFVEVGDYSIDMRVLSGITSINLGNDSAETWINANINITREVVFGSESYFNLTRDKDMARILAVGVRAVIYHEGEIIIVKNINDTDFSPNEELILNLNQIIRKDNVTVTWATVKSYSSLFVYQELNSDHWNILSNSEYSQYHTVNLNRLEEGNYRYYISVIDFQGNRYTDDNNGHFYQFSMVEEKVQQECPTPNPISDLGIVLVFLMVLSLEAVILFKKIKKHGRCNL